MDNHIVYFCKSTNDSRITILWFQELHHYFLPKMVTKEIGAHPRWDKSDDRLGKGCENDTKKVALS